MGAQKTEHEVGGRVALDDEFAPDPYDSDDGGKGVEDSGVDNYTPEVRELMKKCVLISLRPATHADLVAFQVGRRGSEFAS